MTRNDIRKGEHLTLTSYGNGTAYVLIGPDIDLFWQGHDADIFRSELEAVELSSPDLATDEALYRAADPYLYN